MRIGLKFAFVATGAALVPLTAHAQSYDRLRWSHGWDWGWGVGHMAFGGLMMLLFWGGVIVLVVLVVRWLGAGSHGGPTGHPARKGPCDILEERFARGEIDKNEFEERRRLLPD